MPICRPHFFVLLHLEQWIHCVHIFEKAPEQTAISGQLSGVLRVESFAMSDVTLILNAIEQGDSGAADKLLPAVYRELRQLAARKLARERPGHTFQATALVHEAYLRLLGPKEQCFNNRAHFFAAAAEAMRRILIENARRKGSRKHGGDRHRVDLDKAEIAFDPDMPEDLIALDKALAKLTEEDAVKAELVKLRFFAGLTIEQASEIVGVSRATAIRHWSFARTWLLHEIRNT